MTRLRFVARLNPSKTEAGELARYGSVTFAPMDALADGLGGLDTSLERPADELADGSYSYFAEGDLLLAKVTPCFENGKKALVTNLPNRIGFATSEVHVIRPDRRKVDPNYLRYLLSSEAFRAAGIASMTGAGGLRRISDNAIKDFQLPVADLATQNAIAAFLDRETARIDKLIVKRSRFVTLLKEARVAVVARAVTQGIDPSVEFKDSGVDWLGQIPAHWQVVPPTALFTQSKERARDGDQLLSATQKYGVIPLAQYEELEQRQVTLAVTNLEMRKHVEVGDFVISMRSMDGGLERARARGCVRSSYSVLKAGPDVDGRFYGSLLKSSLYVQALRQTANFIRDGQDMNFSHFRKVRLPKLDVQEQAAITDYIDAKTTRIDSLVTLTERSIGLLREHRAALITAAVAGQMDFRENLPTVISTSDRDRFRLVVGAEIIHQHRNNPKFGRVKLQKELYLAEAHLGISELQGNYFRQAAGPLDRALIEETERAVEVVGFYKAEQADGAGTIVTYAPLSNAGLHGAELKSLLGPRAEALGNLIGLLRDFGTEPVEVIATLYAVWNDALMDGRQPDDSMIVNGVLTEWHEEKGKKFKDSDLRHWLEWMRRNGLTPRGNGPRTTPTMTRDMFA